MPAQIKNQKNEEVEMKKAQVQKEDAQCINCREGITNPICPACLAKEIKNWRKDMNLASAPDMDYGVDCILCSRKMSICAHCYCKDVYFDLLEEQPELADEFIETFNFGLKEEFT